MDLSRAVIVGSSLVMIATASTVGALSAGSDRASADSASARVETVVQARLTKLEQNLAEISTQQRQERAEAAAAFDLPPGTAFARPESFDDVKSQISGFEAMRRNSRSISASAIEEPVLYWYEDGFFASLMAIDWQCAWLSTGIDQAESGKVEEVRATVDVLRSFASTEYVSAFPDYDAFLSNQVDPLLAGDVAGARSFLPNCSPSTLVD